MFGLILKQYDGDYEIKYQKTPPRVVNVNYKEIVNELWETEITNDKHF